MENRNDERPNIAYIDDDNFHLEVLVERFQKKSLAVQTFSDADEAINFIKKNPNQFKIIIVDFVLQGIYGDQVIKSIKEINSDIHTVILSSELTNKVTRLCHLAGADHIYDKRSNMDVLLQLSEVAKIKINKYPKSQIEIDENTEIIQSILNLKGRSGILVNIAQRVQIYAQNKENVLILGKSGVGKEKIAEAIHLNSLRKDGPFIPVNCGAISGELVQSELFGHVKGAFTGAISDKKGYFQEANGGTIFLDEIGEMPLNHQVSLLRILQERKVTPVGSGHPVKVNARVIAATNKDLKKLVREGKFREDLYFRLNVLPLNIPSLEERKEDIAPIAQFIVDRKNRETNQSKKISHEAIKYLESLVWKGNIRELEGVLKRGYAGAESTISKSHICQDDEYILGPLDFERAMTKERFPTWQDLKSKLEEYEKKYLQKALGLAGGSRSMAAKMAGLPYTSYVHKRKRFSLDFDTNI